MPASTSTPRVNIQHIESLNDVVAQITRVRVREMVPDAILDRADAIELVDLTPDDLIQRLKEGKVYVPKQAERALKHYFSPANLTALRELALRRTAERVDEQLLEQMQARAIPGPWAAGERILVCVSEDPRSAGLVRYAKRLADRLRAPWTALYIETRRSLQLGEATSATGSPRPCGWPSASTARRSRVPPAARRIADDVIGFAHKSNVTHIVIGKSDALALVRDPARVGGARPGAAGRQHQRPRHRRRGAAAEHVPPQGRAVATDAARRVRSAALHRRPARGRGRARRRAVCCGPCSASRTSTSSS